MVHRRKALGANRSALELSRAGAAINRLCFPKAVSEKQLIDSSIVLIARPPAGPASYEGERRKRSWGQACSLRPDRRGCSPSNAVGRGRSSRGELEGRVSSTCFLT